MLGPVLRPRRGLLRALLYSFLLSFLLSLLFSLFCLIECRFSIPPSGLIGRGGIEKEKDPLRVGSCSPLFLGLLGLSRQNSARFCFGDNGASVDDGGSGSGSGRGSGSDRGCERIVVRGDGGVAIPRGETDLILLVCGCKYWFVCGGVGVRCTISLG